MANASAPAYPSYKPSGHDWIGDIPTEWEVTKLGACLKVVSEKNHPDLPLLSITRELGIIERDVEDRESNHNFIPDDLSGYKLIKAGQFGMNKMKAWQGSYGVSRHTGIVSPAYFIFDFTKPIDPNFFHLAIRGKIYVSYFASASDGVRIGQWDLSKPRMREIPFVLPPINQQREIVRFLNGKTAKIDDAIALEERQIAFLKERKQIVIQNAVTKGLNPSAPKKDSGVDWIGEIPRHWATVPLKRIFFEKTERTETGEEVLLSLRMHEGLVPHDDVSDKPISAAELKGYKKVRCGQIVMNRMRASIGLFGLASSSGLVSPDYAIFDIADVVHAPFFLRLFKTPLLGQRFRDASRGLGTGSAGFMRLYTDEFGSISVAIPPLAEQREIVTTMDREAGKIEDAVRLKLQQIANFKEYKASLIHSAVTGKIKVA